MSDEMAVGDNASSEEAIAGSDDIAEDATDSGRVSQASIEPSTQESEKTRKSTEDIKTTANSTTSNEKISDDKNDEKDPDEQRGIKRRASAAFSDELDTEFKGFEQDDQCDLTEFNKIVEEEWNFLRRYSTDEDFKGFDHVENNNLTGYSRILEHLEAEVSEAVKNMTPLRKVLTAPSRASKRPRQDTDSSRPSSALSTRSDGDAATDHQRINGRKEEIKASSSPASRGRRPTTEMSSPLLRVPLERGWKRELVFRAALDAHSRRNADIYYYTPHGKKLRSTREVSENLSGTGLTIENFSFFKEPLGVDDPEKEIIRDAKVMRRVESPVQAPAAVVLEAKRTPKPKPPKGASPEPSTPKSPPAKLKVKSIGSRLNNNSSPASPVPQKQPRRQSAQAQPQAQTPPPPPQPPAADNNNTAAWKKPRTAPPPLHARPQHPNAHTQMGRGVQQPCSMSCGRGAVPSLACAACLCLYHPACLGLSHAPAHPFFCKNCDTSSPREPPPLIHKSGVPASSGLPTPTPVPATPVSSVQSGDTVPVPRRVLVPSKGQKSDKRVLLRMKMSGGADGQKVWAVSPSGSSGPTQPPQTPSVPVAQPAPLAPQPPVAPPTPPVTAVSTAPPRHTLPQSEKLGRGRVNGAASPPASLASPRRRGRPRVDETDHFAAFYKRAQEKNYNIAVQIFQYVGMRDLARCARVCKLWQTLTDTPALWRHVRMKNSHVSDWGGLCAVLKKHSTKWLDLRKMLLPTNDTIFWDQFIENIGTIDTLERLELCRCPARAVEAVCRRVHSLRALCAPAICDTSFDPAPLAELQRLELLRLKSLKGLSLTRDLQPLSALRNLQHLSLTSIKELGWCACEVVGQLEQLESLELGECSFGGAFASALARLVRLRRLRLERGVPHCAAPALLKALASLPKLTRLELVNFDVKVGFDDALAECKNIQRLLIIPTYVSQSATTNKQVLSAVLRLKDTLTHLMWGVTIELLRVTELFIDQCEAGGEVEALGGEGGAGAGGGEGGARRELGECIPVLKPVPGCRLPDDLRHVAGPPQVEILPIPTLQRLLSAQLPNTKLKLLRIPFHATWRQTLADFQ